MIFLYIYLVGYLLTFIALLGPVTRTMMSAGDKHWRQWDGVTWAGGIIFHGGVFSLLWPVFLPGLLAVIVIRRIARFIMVHNPPFITKPLNLILTGFMPREARLLDREEDLAHSRRQLDKQQKELAIKTAALSEMQRQELATIEQEQALHRAVENGWQQPKKTASATDLSTLLRRRQRPNKP